MLAEQETATAVQLAMEEELPQVVGPGDAEANQKVDPMLRDVPGLEGEEVPKASFLREAMSGEFESNKRKAADRLRRVAGQVQKGEACRGSCGWGTLPQRGAATR